MTLKDEGHRFVYNSKSNIYTWLHPAMIKDDHIDCTDMDDCAFEAFVYEMRCNRHSDGNQEGIGK